MGISNKLDKTSNRHITRIVYPTGGGFWWVRFWIDKRCNNGKPRIQKTFCDLKYGSKEEAFKAAQRFRNHVATAYNIPLHKSLRKYKTVSRCNTGVVGVSLCDSIRGNGRHVTCYAVCYRKTEGDKRVSKTKSFYFNEEKNKDSKADALKRAIEFRKRMEALHYNGSIP